MLCWNISVLSEHWEDCVSTAEFYRSPQQAVLVSKGTIRGLGRLCWYNRVL